MLHSFTIAETTFGVEVQDEGFNGLIQERYSPFVQEEQKNEFVIVVESLNSLEDKLAECTFVERFGNGAPYIWLYRLNEGFVVGFSDRKNVPSALLFGGNKLYVDNSVSKEEQECCLNNALMFQYSVFSAANQSLVIHASVVTYKGKGYAFLGKSGTGKSTHSRMWLNNLEGVELLNDDNPVIHLVDGIPYIYGTAWSGKTSCYKNQCVPLGGIVRLIQAPHNRIQKLAIVESYGSLMSSCSNVFWNKEYKEQTLETIAAVVAKCSSWQLECLPNSDAARMCCEAVSGENQ